MSEKAIFPAMDEGDSDQATAVALAMAGASRTEADAYLRDQRNHLHEQLKQIHLGLWEVRLGVFLRLATAVVGVAFATALALMIWQASSSNGLIIESFSVPPDMATRGLTGEVVAARVLDRLTLLQSQTPTARPAKSYSNTWNEHGIKLEIPETGISLSELDNWLRQKLGHDLRVSGEIVRTATGITVTARAGEQGAETVSGPDTDVDVLVGQLADSIYRMTQPFRYGIYLMRHENRAVDAVPVFKELALNGTPDDRAWSYNMWAQAAGVAAGDSELQLRMYQQAQAADPDATVVYFNLTGSLYSFGRYEEALKSFGDWHTHLIGGKQRTTPANEVPAADGRQKADRDNLIGAFHDAGPVYVDSIRIGIPGLGRVVLLNRLIRSQLGEHDLAGVRASLADHPADNASRAYGLLQALAAEDWRTALGLGDAMAAYLKENPHDRHVTLMLYARPLAYAQAQLGDFAKAERSIAPTPANCYPCLITRAQIAELRGQHGRADWWFARATETAPSFAFAFNEEGKTLLTRGKPDEAVSRFTIANQKSPHFADPLEGWGEALMMKNQSHLALAKFTEAEQYAPNWGRLHLKWGEALAYSGKKDEAKAQFVRAAALDLTPSEKSELASMRPHV
jgi:tetratricopeptide (TPR) repeat protein